MWQCYYCQCVLTKEMITKNRLCPTCSSDLHCCKNCTHFDESLSSKCKEPESPWFGDRDKQNNCSFFEFKSKEKSGSASYSSADAEKAKEAARALFRS